MNLTNQTKHSIISYYTNYIEAQTMTDEYHIHVDDLSNTDLLKVLKDILYTLKEWKIENLDFENLDSYISKINLQIRLLSKEV